MNHYMPNVYLDDHWSDGRQGDNIGNMIARREEERELRPRPQTSVLVEQIVKGGIEADSVGEMCFLHSRLVEIVCWVSRALS